MSRASRIWGGGGTWFPVDAYWGLLEEVLAWGEVVLGVGIGCWEEKGALDLERGALDLGRGALDFRPAVFSGKLIREWGRGRFRVWGRSGGRETACW